MTFYEIIIGSNSYATIDNYIFNNTYYEDNIHQFILLGSELNTAGVLEQDSLTGISFKIAEVSGMDIQNFRIKIQNTNLTSLDSDDPPISEGWTEVFYGNITVSEQVANSWLYFTFDEDFVYNGGNLLIETSRDLNTYASGGGIYCYTVANPYRALASFGDGLSHPYYSSLALMQVTDVPCVKIGVTYDLDYVYNQDILTVTEGYDTFQTDGYRRLEEHFQNGVPDYFYYDINEYIINTNYESYGFGYVLQTRPVEHNTYCEYSLTLNYEVDGTFQFYRKVSSESNYDFFSFYIDSSVQFSISGEQNWSLVTYNISAGLHTFKWKYSKDRSGSNGLDAGLIAEIIALGVNTDINIEKIYANITCSDNHIIIIHEQIIKATTSCFDSYYQAIHNQIIKATTVIPPHKFPSGTGTIEDPYIVSTAEDLYIVRDYVNSYFKQDRDIDLTSFDNWTPIGYVDGAWTSSLAFRGGYNGDGHSVTGLNATAINGKGIGLFGCWYPNNSVNKIENLHVSGNVSGLSQVGILLGMLFQSDTIYNVQIANCITSGTVACNSPSAERTLYMVGFGGLLGETNGDRPCAMSYCHSDAVITDGHDSCGGLVGVGYNMSFDNCYATGSVTSSGSMSGGLIGDTSSYLMLGYGNRTITDCYSTGNVSSAGFAGGLIGLTGHYRITQCYSTGNVSGTVAGGLVANDVNGEATSRYERCYTLSNVIGNSYTGGLIGRCENGVTLVDCFCRGTVTGTYMNTGTMIGRQYYGMTMTHCYAGNAGSVLSNRYETQGAAICVYGGTLTLDSNYYDGTKNEPYFDLNITEVSTTQLQTQSTYVGWDFDTVWIIDPSINDGHPYLRALPMGGLPRLCGISDIYVITGTDTISQISNVYMITDSGLVEITNQYILSN